MECGKLLFYYQQRACLRQCNKLQLASLWVNFEFSLMNNKLIAAGVSLVVPDHLEDEKFS
jgi:hypothetical protein